MTDYDLYGNPHMYFDDCNESVKRKDGIPASDSEVGYAYFIHLCNMVGLNNGSRSIDVFNSDRSFFNLARKLYSTKYKWIIQRDANREADAKSVRWAFENISSSFCRYDSIEGMDINWLEVLVALAQRIDREILRGLDEHDRSSKWFWLMVGNLGLDYYTDDKWTFEAEMFVGNVLETLNNRLYSANGQGGLFPLREPKEDQRNVEIWYQMQYYIRENYEKLMGYLE